MVSKSPAKLPSAMLVDMVILKSQLNLCISILRHFFWWRGKGWVSLEAEPSLYFIPLENLNLGTEARRRLLSSQAMLSLLGVLRIVNTNQQTQYTRLEKGTGGVNWGDKTGGGEKNKLSKLSSSVPSFTPHTWLSILFSIHLLLQSLVSLFGQK